MSFNLGTVLIGTAFIASVYLLLSRSDRVFPLIAVIAAGVELLLVAHVMSLSISKLRIDVALPALLVVAGGVCWGRASEKGAVSAATAVTLVGAIQLLLALKMF
jgi:hypothetical protein